MTRPGIDRRLCDRQGMESNGSDFRVDNPHQSRCRLGAAWPIRPQDPVLCFWRGLYPARADARPWHGSDSSSLTSFTWVHRGREAEYLTRWAGRRAYMRPQRRRPYEASSAPTSSTRRSQAFQSRASLDAMLSPSWGLAGSRWARNIPLPGAAYYDWGVSIPAPGWARARTLRP